MTDKIRLLDISREDYWDTEDNQPVTIYTVANKAELTKLCWEFRCLGYKFTMFMDTIRELERPEHYVVIKLITIRN